MSSQNSKRVLRDFVLLISVKAEVGMESVMHVCMCMYQGIRLIQGELTQGPASLRLSEGSF
jgi:hypothetical protein